MCVWVLHKRREIAYDVCTMYMYDMYLKWKSQGPHTCALMRTICTTRFKCEACQSLHMCGGVHVLLLLLLLLRLPSHTPTQLSSTRQRHCAHLSKRSVRTVRYVTALVYANMQQHTTTRARA